MTLNAPYFMQTSRHVLRGIGNRLRDRRIAADLTQEQLAKRAGLSRTTVTRLELGDNIGVEPLVRLAIALDAVAEFAGLFPPAETRSLDEILAAERKPQRVRHRASSPDERPA
jgi:putative transcriptional regulator